MIIEESNGFRYVETNGGDEVLLLLHGLFGALSNFNGLLDHFGNKFNVVIPILPIYDLPLKEAGLEGLVKYVKEFVEYKKFSKVHLLGNSLGGHIAQLYTLSVPQKVNSLILTGSSGLFESAMGRTFPKRGDYNFIRKKAESTFYNPKIANKRLVDEIFDIVNDRAKALKIVITAKSAVRHNLEDKLHKIKHPTLLVWGRQDQITPPFVGEKFNEMLENSQLVIMDKCGHAPMMEKPKAFNKYLNRFLDTVRESN